VYVDILFIPLLFILWLLTLLFSYCSLCTYSIDMRAKPKIIALNFYYAH